MAIDYQSDCIVCDAEYREMEKFCNLVSDLARYSEDYYDEGTAFYSGDVLIDTDRWVHEECEDEKAEAILAFYEVTAEELSAWIEKNAEVHHWISVTTWPRNCIGSDLDDWIRDYESDEKADSDEE